jgi:phage terminase large subunit
MWSIYGEGKPAKNNELVYTHYKTYTDDELYVTDGEGKKIPIYEDFVYGADWGWNHPSAIVKVYINHTYKRIWCEELIYGSYMTTDDVIKRMKDLQLDPNVEIICDSAEPKTIESVRRAGFNAVPGIKDVTEGIDLIKSSEFFVNINSINTISELRRFKWKMRNEMKTDEPIKLFDDALSAIRYAYYTYYNRIKKSRDYDYDVEWIDL